MIDRRLIATLLGAAAVVAGPVWLVDHIARGEPPKGAPGDTAAKPDPAPPKAPPVVTPLDDLATKVAAPDAGDTRADDATPAPEPDDVGIWVEIGIAPPPEPAADAPDAAADAKGKADIDGEADAPDAAGAPEAPDAPALADETPRESSLADREEALARTHQALLDQMKTLQELQKQVEVRWKEADALMTAAGTRWKEKATMPTPGGTLQLPPTMLEANETITQVVAIVKKMKPKAAAAMVAKWDDPLAVDVIGRLSARVASPVLAALPPERAARVTRLLARAGLPTPLPQTSEEEAL